MKDVYVWPVEGLDACVFDEQVPTDAEGRYTIVVSTAEDRPANARRECGVAWLHWSEKGDWLDHPTKAFLIMRNQLAAPAFAQASTR